MLNKRGGLFFFLILLIAGLFCFGKNVLASETIAGWTFPADSNGTANLGSVNNLQIKTISGSGISSITFNMYDGFSTKSAMAKGWTDGNGIKYWQTEIDTTGYESLQVFSKQKSSNTGPRDFILQYKIGTEEAWNDIATITSENSFKTTNVALPMNCANQLTIYIRWIMNSNNSVVGGTVQSIGTSYIDDVIVTGDPIINETNNSSDPEREANQDNKSESIYDGLRISEIMYDPSGSNSEHAKWVELFNTSDQKITLESSQTSSGWKIKDLKFADPSNHYLYAQNSNPIEINPGEFLLITNNLDNFFKDYPDIKFPVLKSALSLTNASGYYNLTLFDSDYVLDSIDYSKDWGACDNGKSLEKNNLSGENSENWHESCISGGTPGQKNTSPNMCPEEAEEIDDFETYDYKIRLNELLPIPKDDKETDSYIELYNEEDFDINLSNWIIKNNSKTVKFIFPEGYSIKSRKYLTVYRKDFKFALKTTDTISLLDPDGNAISAASYTGAKKEISWGFDGENWKWSKFPTPGKENEFSKVPKIKIGKIKEAYVSMPVLFSAEVKTSKKDKKDLKYRWDFGDGKISYLESVNHTYLKKGNYQIILSVDNGIEKITKEFELKVKNYPKFELEITGLSPNPTDVENKWIEIKNNSAKKVNLKNWKIATGSNKPVNHVVLSDFEIDPGQSKRLTQEYALFSLNKRGTQVELRYPNDKVADKASYSKDKMEKDEIYLKINGIWNWIKKESNAAKENNEENSTTDDQKEISENIESDSSFENDDKVLGTSETRDGDEEKNELPTISDIPKRRLPVKILMGMRDLSNYFFDGMIASFE